MAALRASSLALALFVIAGCLRPSMRGLSAGHLEIPATYDGKLPCADCPGIATTLTLRADSTFTMRSVYLERDPRPRLDHGRWSVDVERRLVLHGGTQAAPRRFAIVDAATLRMLDTQGQPIESRLDYNLKRAARVEPLGDSNDEGIASTNALVGLKWTCIELNGKPIPESVPAPTLTFSADAGRVTGTTGCNNVMGTFTLGADGLRFGRAASTRKLCSGPAMEIEAAFLKLLETTTQHRIHGESLELSGTGGGSAKFSHE
jgi:heat shock protein HslJ